MRGKMKSWTEMEMKVEVAVAMSDETMGVSRPVEPNFEVRTWCDELEGDREEVGLCIRAVVTKCI